MLNNGKTLRFLDLFAGAGGMSEGFIRAGFESVAHVESNRAASYTLKTRAAYHWLRQQGELDRYFAYLKGDIQRSQLYSMVPEAVIASVINEEIGQKTLPGIFSDIDRLIKTESLDLIIGGPPCQAYSVVGRSRDKNGMIGDMRNYLYEYYASFLAKYQPKYFVFENVTGLLSAKDVNGGRYFDNMKRLFKEVGYETDHRVLSANHYGVLQQRKRVILVGNRNEIPNFFPEPETCISDVKVQEILADLPPIGAGGGNVGPTRLLRYDGEYLYEAQIRTGRDWVTLHSARPHIKRDLEIYRIVVKHWNEFQERLHYYNLPDHLKTHANERVFTDRYKVVAANLPVSQTVVAHIAKDGHYYIHPDINQNRSLTPREAARLQTFPDDYFFESEAEQPRRTAPFRQIGNAVPVLLAQKIAEKFREAY